MFPILHHPFIIKSNQYFSTIWLFNSCNWLKQATAGTTTITTEKKVAGGQRVAVAVLCFRKWRQNFGIKCPTTIQQQQQQIDLIYLLLNTYWTFQISKLIRFVCCSLCFHHHYWTEKTQNQNEGGKKKKLKPEAVK